ncbi:MAG: aminotransferase class V-fold PLP-dependent enzyme [Cardiobacteriaceae bacterium]|nr:aminotransferase class V-fold PLP-dependent enzyme [Cardiobacteriaceae bacterium]
MAHFGSDYLAGCHPAILEKLCETNLLQTNGYGQDPYCEAAREKIRKAVGSEQVDVHFLVGGTQTNATVIAAALRPYQGVIASEWGHITTHETGAIEAGGHKVLALPSADGKLSAEQVRAYFEREYQQSTVQEHIVQPSMVYLSQSTEFGTVYQKEELQALSQICREYGLWLFVDGARLGYTLDASVSDVTLHDLATLCDVFYIGGTKCGALFGEAVVIVNPALKPHFRAMMKQQGALLAKGRLLGVQFDVLFSDNLYARICQQAVVFAQIIRQAFEEKGFAFYGQSTTNQQFPIVNRAQADLLMHDFGFAYWQAHGTQHVVRYCTSWATTQAEVDSLLQAIGNLS